MGIAAGVMPALKSCRRQLHKRMLGSVPHGVGATIIALPLVCSATRLFTPSEVYAILS